MFCSLIIITNSHWQKFWRIVLFCYAVESGGWTEVITESNTAEASHVSNLLSSSTAEKGSIYVQHICLLSVCCVYCCGKAGDD